MSTANLLSNRYELGDTLGYGGMSEVHHGHDVRLGREVAVKILRADLARDSVFQERFRREAQNSAALNHPAIVAVYDTGETDSEFGPLPYIVMEYVEGRTLRDIVKTQGPLDPKRAMEVMADVCAALDFSHRHGIVHRDVKPANVMISKTGAVKVMDFGIARAIHDGQAAMTQTAAVIGTAQYLSPEQARGESVDARSDVYAAGCVLYELLTGEPPFTGDSPVAVAYQHVREDATAPSLINPNISPELDAVVLKALTKGPANRYQSAAEMRTDLVRVLSQQRPAAPMVMTADDRTQVMGAGGSHQDDYDEYAQGYDYDDYAAIEAEERQRRRRRMIAVLALLGVAVLAAILWLADPFGSDNNVAAVPNIVGQKVDPAELALRDAGFSDIEKEGVKCMPTAFGEAAPCDPQTDVQRVIEVNPAENTQVDVTQTITMKYGLLPEEIQMPKLVGKKQAEAERIVEENNLLLDPNVKKVENTDPKKTGKVAKQTPAANEFIDEGSVVTLSVFAKPEMVEVTDYTGKSFETADAGLRAVGFDVERVDVDSDKPEGTVVGQNPSSGKAVKGSTVTVEVSNGSQQVMQMPDVIDKTEDEAKQMLADAGHVGDVEVVKNEVDDPSRNGLVSSSDPDVGNDMRRSDSVTLYVDEYVDDGDDGGNGNGGGNGDGNSIFDPGSAGTRDDDG
ncbi:Stk1 family PASTA domain-containing Ser/Thr kinase [Haloechinothrix halophila]|uniref:Stk1 family PASTA domain-containing Ser/Thr kinase n=1 Tax=Haloechinothrix halophila TaxID=1069073 RepID=UPI0004044EBC|nr:Stk1 family PASTA domain-containing Ser/Thr kinase [Haloechinothrix halophila]